MSADHLALELAVTIRHDGHGGITDALASPAGLTRWIREHAAALAEYGFFAAVAYGGSAEGPAGGSPAAGPPAPGQLGAGRAEFAGASPHAAESPADRHALLGQLGVGRDEFAVASRRAAELPTAGRPGPHQPPVGREEFAASSRHAEEVPAAGQPAPRQHPAGYGEFTAGPATLAAVLDVRTAVRALFARAVAPGPPSAADAGRLPDADAALERLNAVSARVPVAPRLSWPAEGRPVARYAVPGDPGLDDRLAAALARAAIAFLSGPDPARLRACPAPRCVLYFVQTHARQEWCRPSCGNRARVARHHARRRDAVTGATGPEPDRPSGRPEG